MKGPSRFYPLFLSLFFLFFAQACLSSNVWDVLRAQFSLNHEVTQPAVQTQLRWLISHPSYLRKLAQSEPYIYHIATEIQKKNMPGELALLPMLESAYDPFAYSGAGAAGLWQLMPGTGNDLGLKQDWWFDARRSIGPSTEAALNYLTYLNQRFHGEWNLAMAAYDSGEGTVLKAIERSGQPVARAHFWHLSLPQETQAYVPRLLALAEIIKYPNRYHVALPDIPHTPYFAEVNIGSQIDLNHAAKLAGISYRDLIKLNPGCNRWATAPYKPFKLLIPANKVARFNQNLAQTPNNKRVNWVQHRVQPGDSLESIARRYFTTAKLIQNVNQLTSSRLRRGQSILIPGTKEVAHLPENRANTPQPRASTRPLLQKYKVIHVVQHGDSVERLSRRYHVSTASIRQWNHIPSNRSLTYHQALIIWQKPVKTQVYRIQAGDTLSGIAQRHHTSVRKLVQLNPGLDTQRLKLGRQLVV